MVAPRRRLRFKSRKIGHTDAIDKIGDLTITVKESFVPNEQTAISLALPFNEGKTK